MFILTICQLVNNSAIKIPKLYVGIIVIKMSKFLTASDGHSEGYLGVCDNKVLVENLHASKE